MSISTQRDTYNKSVYRNRWIREEAKQILENETGSILDVGGGAAPYVNANHIMDCLDFNPDHLSRNHWGHPNSKASGRSTKQQYTKIDLCDKHQWAFKDIAFDLALASHVLEDLPDPFPAVKEMIRVAKNVLILTPSRLAEQTKGIDYVNEVGFIHHNWIVHQDGTTIHFRRKTPNLKKRRCHIKNPIGKILKLEHGASYFYGADLSVSLHTFDDPDRDIKDLRDFVAPYHKRTDLFDTDGKKQDLKFWIWRFRQQFLGHV
jgi:SAM-dependent methyltransferase